MARNEQPLHSRIDLASSPAAVPRGRKKTAEILAEWGVAGPVAENALLVVSELLTNAVQHAVAPPDLVENDPDAVTCSLLLWLTDNGLTVAVYDTDRRPPIVRSAHSDAERGRGLHLVEALSAAWGYTRPSPDAGKLVWARLPPPGDPVDDGPRNPEATSRLAATGAEAARGA